MPKRHALLPLLLFAASLSFVPATLAQDAVNTHTAVSSTHGTCSFSIGPNIVSTQGARPSAPYSATEESSHTQTLADGTHITQRPRVSKTYRDSQGRTRREQSFCNMDPNDGFTSIVVIIRDPVDGVGYVLDTQNHVAHRVTASGDTKSQVAASVPAAGSSSAASHVSVFSSNAPSAGISTATSSVTSTTGVALTTRAVAIESESLGTQVIEGLTVEGTRTTETIPVNAEGNDQPIKIVRESWFSPDLKTTVLSKNNDPRMGENTFRLVDVNLSEPDPALFRPPADYKIVDDSSSVHIEYTR
jgi:hypothetical protein